MKNALFAPDDKLAEYVIDNMGHASSGVITIEDGTNMDLPLPDLQEPRGVFLISDQDILVTLNGGQQEQMLKASEGLDDAPTYCRFFFEGAISSVNLEKPATIPATDARIRWVVWGNPEA